MSDLPSILDNILAQSRMLSPQERVRLIERLAADLGVYVASQVSEGRSLQDLWSDLGSGPSEALLKQARQEAWGNFPRDGIVDEGG